MIMVGSVHRFYIDNYASCSPLHFLSTENFILFSLSVFSLYFLLFISDSTCKESTLYKEFGYLIMMKSAKLILFL